VWAAQKAQWLLSLLDCWLLELALGQSMCLSLGVVGLGGVAGRRHEGLL
jgi:hypothetical protein